MVAKRPPLHKFDTFRRACSMKGAVIVRKKARADASEHFDLYTETELLEFIAEGRLENVEHENTSTLDNCHPKDTGKTFDAYNFTIGPNKHGYIAFYINFRDKWEVKSFHPPIHGPNSKGNKVLTHNLLHELSGVKIK